MADELRFLPSFFLKKKYELENMTIALEERASYDTQTEDYRFRIKIAEVIDEIDVYYRDIAIEDHHHQTKHQKPHLQFKLHADKVGHIHIFLPVKSASDYKRYILSFLDIIGSILLSIDTPKKELENNFMIMKSFNKIKGKGEAIKDLIHEQYKQKRLMLLNFKKEEKKISGEDLKKIKRITQISPFFEKVV